MENNISYKIEYEELDLHWQVILMNPTNDERRIVMRFTNRDQAEIYVENQLNPTWENEDNSEKEG